MNPYAVSVETEKVADATRYIVVVAAKLMRVVDTGITCVLAVPSVPATWPRAPAAGKVGNASVVCDIEAAARIRTVPAAPVMTTLPLTSQSPAVSEMEVIVLAVAVTSETAAPTSTVDEIYSPIAPAAALSFVAVAALKVG